MSDNYTPGDNRGSQGEIRYLSIAKVSDAHLLLTLPTANTKKAYAEEVRLNKVFVKFISKQYYFPFHKF